MATKTFDKLLAAYASDAQTLALRARKFILELLPGAEESVDTSAPVIGYGYGPGYKGLICTLILSQSGVKLGLVRGAEFADPNGLLEGSGKTHRYVSLKTPSDLRRPGLKKLVQAAVAARRERNGRAASNHAMQGAALRAAADAESVRRRIAR